MSRALLVCPEPLAHGQPAGIGIRFIEMARVLRHDGHSITILSPDAGAIEGCSSDFVNPTTLRSGVASHDVAIVQGHVANALFPEATAIPIVVDLYDPFIIENLHYFAERGPGVFRHDHATMMRSLERGDFFLCASHAQRLFYLGLLLACRRLNPAIFESDPGLDSLIAVAPFGVHPPRPPRSPRLDAPAILYGGIYDWYDPVAAIEAVAIARASLPQATLTFTTHPNPELTPQGKLAEAIQHARSRSYDFVRFEPWAPYERRAESFERFALALLTFRPSLETDLSMRTRIYDYLWCGLPVVSSSAPGTDEILRRYDAGLVVGGVSPAVFAEAIVSLLQSKTMYDQKVAGTQRFVADHQWPGTLAPLREFCRHPQRDATKEAFAARTAQNDRSPSVLDRIRRRLHA